MKQLLHRPSITGPREIFLPSAIVQSYFGPRSWPIGGSETVTRGGLEDSRVFATQSWS
jgi:hypothetical protein